jgi:hypothetical protein
MIFAIITVIGVSVAGYNAIHSFNFTNSKDWNFDSYQNNAVPPDLAAMETDPNPGLWVIKADDSAPSPPNVLAKIPGNDNSTYHIQIMPDSPTVTDADVSVKFKIVSGQKAEAAGLIVRFIDKSHYFVLMADAMNNRLSLCKSDIDFVVCNYEAPAQISVGQWHTLRASVSAEGIGGYLDDKLFIKANNQYYQNGEIGLWTKEDTTAYFDDLKMDY